MSSIVGAAVLAAFVGQASAFPGLYDSEHTGCTIPDMGFAGHGAPAPSELVTMTVMSGTEAVTSFTPGEEYTISVPGYDGAVNMWIHATDGIMAPVDATAHQTATACMEAAFSLSPAATHEFTWTAPDTADPVTISVAQAASPADAYKTNTMTIMGGGAAGAPAGAPAAGALPEDMEDPAVEEDPVAPTTPPADDADDAATEEGEAETTNSAVGVATGAFAAAVAAAAALAL